MSSNVAIPVCLIFPSTQCHTSLASALSMYILPFHPSSHPNAFPFLPFRPVLLPPLPPSLYSPIFPRFNFVHVTFLSAVNHTHTPFLYLLSSMSSSFPTSIPVSTCIPCFSLAHVVFPSALNHTHIPSHSSSTFVPSIPTSFPVPTYILHFSLSVLAFLATLDQARIPSFSSKSPSSLTSIDPRVQIYPSLQPCPRKAFLSTLAHTHIPFLSSKSPAFTTSIDLRVQIYPSLQLCPRLLFLPILYRIIRPSFPSFPPCLLPSLSRSLCLPISLASAMYMYSPPFHPISHLYSLPFPSCAPYIAPILIPFSFCCTLNRTYTHFLFTLYRTYTPFLFLHFPLILPCLPIHCFSFLPSFVPCIYHFGLRHVIFPFRTISHSFPTSFIFFSFPHCPFLLSHLLPFFHPFIISSSFPASSPVPTAHYYPPLQPHPC